ncbi:MAG: hypothetical protein DWQ04_00420 [Chloroflexi bacterium]|nr:MAG: hypothetical protein DWQ04_00420 [Chloroflexota bacterium]
MKSTNKILIGIVAGVVLLVIAAFVVTLNKPPISYQDESTPDGVVHNYLLALQKEEYERAYRYLSPTLPGYPSDLEEFSADIKQYSWRFRFQRDTSLSITATNVGVQGATVTVRETEYRNPDLFGGGTSVKTFEMTLLPSNKSWQIVNSEAYWRPCWEKNNGCS